MSSTVMLQHVRSSSVRQGVASLRTNFAAKDMVSDLIFQGPRAAAVSAKRGASAVRCAFKAGDAALLHLLGILCSLPVAARAP